MGPTLMSDISQGPGWRRAANGKWYPPEHWEPRQAAPSSSGSASHPGVSRRPPDTSHKGFSWRAWHVALVALVALVVGVVIGGATGKTTTKTITASPPPTRTGAVSAA